MHSLIYLSAASIVLALAAYAIWLHLKLTKQQKRSKQLLAEQEIAAEKNMQRIHSDIKFLATAYINAQVDLPEVSLRISKLLDCLQLNTEQRQAFQVFDNVRMLIEEIPTHQDWKALDKSTKKQHQQTFANIEKNYAEDAKATAIHISNPHWRLIPGR